MSDVMFMIWDNFVINDVQQVRDWTIFELIVFIEKQPVRASFCPVIRFKWNLSFGKSTKQFINNVFTSP
jgi:hypothetical protein